MKYILICIFLLPNLVAAEIIISEFMPNPIGNDRGNAPEGEWVELYNQGTTSVRIAQYILYDNNNENELYIKQEYIQPKEYLVIYREKDTDFNLNNKGDSVRLKLFNKEINKVTYNQSKEGISKALTKTGWVDSCPTPGKPNEKENCNISLKNETKSNETIIKKTKTTIYESKERKSKRYAIYFFCLSLILYTIYNMRKEK